MSTTHDPRHDHDPVEPGAAATGAPDRASGDSPQDAAERARAEGMAQIDHYRYLAADEVDRLAHGARAAVFALDDGLDAGMSRYIQDMTAGMSRLSSGLREKSSEQILRDAKRIARDHPALFIAGSVALGLGLSRLGNASSTRQAERRSGPGGGSAASGVAGDAVSDGGATGPDADRQ